MSDGIRVWRMKNTSDLAVTEPGVSSPTTAADFYNPRRTASYGVVSEPVYQGSVASSGLQAGDDKGRGLIPAKAPRSTPAYPPVPISIGSTAASTGMPDMRLVWEAADRVPDMAAGMHHPGHLCSHPSGPPASHAHVAHSPPDRFGYGPEIRHPTSISSSHAPSAVLDSDNIAHAWRNATEQLYELEHCRDTHDPEASVHSSHSGGSYPGAPHSHTVEPTHPSVIPLLEGSPGHASPFHQPVPPLHHRPSTRSSTASHTMAATATASLQHPPPNRGNYTARTHHTDPQPSPRRAAQVRLESSSTVSHRASPRLDSASVSLLAPAALQYGRVMRVPSAAGSGYGANAPGGKAAIQRSIYAPSDDESDGGGGAPEDSAYGTGRYGGGGTPAPSAVGAATVTTNDDVNALATYTWTGSDTDGGRSALNAAGAARHALGVRPPRRSEGAARGGAAPGPALATGVHNVGSSSHFPSARVMLPQCGEEGSATSSDAGQGPRVSCGMHAVSASGAADGCGVSLELSEHHGTREARRATISKLQLFSAILFFAGMNDVAELETIVQENDIDICDVRDYDGRTPLHLAAAEGSLAATEWLLQQGVDPSSVDRFGRTPLMDALLSGRTPVAQILLHAGARVLENEALLLASESAAFCTLASNVPAALAHINHPDWEICPDELTLGAVLGEGEFGVVHSGRWNGTPVAIKVLKSSANVRRDQLASEIAVLLKVHHPNIVQFLGACTRSEPVVIVSEIMDGGSLEDALRLRRRLPLRRALEIALDCARGLNYLHLANPHAMIHRDLKPSNVMLAGSGTAMGKDELLLDTGVAKLTDFGLSKTIASVLPPPPLFGSGARGGSAGDFPRFAEGSRGEDSGCGGPRLRFDGVSQRHTSPQLVAREVSAGSLQAQARPQLRPEAISHESAHDTRSTHSGVPGECLAEDSGGHVATGHFNTISSSLRHTSSAEIAAAGAPPHRRAASANLRTPPATHDMHKKAFLEQQFQMTGGTGSYTFMAGEIFRHEPYNAKADVYSFAMVLYEMLAGERPFARLDPIVAAMRAATDGLRPEWPRDAPAEYNAQERELLSEVQALVERCWAASPMMRPSSGEIISELEELLAQLRAQRQRYARMVQDTEVTGRRSSSVGCFALPRRNRGSASMPGGTAGCSDMRRGSASCRGDAGCNRPFRGRRHGAPRPSKAAGGTAARRSGGGRRGGDALSPGRRSPGVRRASGGGLSTFESPREREPLLLCDGQAPAGLTRSPSADGGGGDGSLQVMLRRLGGSWKKGRTRANRGSGWLGGSADLTGSGGFRAIGEKRMGGVRRASSHLVAEWADLDEALWRRWLCITK